MLHADTVVDVVVLLLACVVVCCCVTDTVIALCFAAVWFYCLFRKPRGREGEKERHTNGSDLIDKGNANIFVCQTTVSETIREHGIELIDSVW